MKFEVSPIIFKSKVIEAFDANFSFPINLKTILKPFTFVSHIDNLSLLFSCEKMEVMEHLSKYFTFESKLENFSQIHLFLFQKCDDLSSLKRNSLFSSKKSSVSIGKNINENTVYLIDERVYVEKDSGGSLTNIYYSNINDLGFVYPIIIKIVESLISEYFLIKGFLPIHCSTGIHHETNELYLILGESKSGKTSFIIENETFQLIGDEYCFFREDRIVPFDLFYKSYCWGNEEFDEEFDGYKRKVNKISRTSTKYINSVDKIIFITNDNLEDLHLITDNNYKISLLMEYLSNLPGKLYLSEEKKYFPLVVSTTKEFMKIPVYVK